jgi:hypothetical protein
MSMQEILSEINRLPLQDRLLIIEKTLEVTRANESDQQLSAASDMMEAEYRSNKELTAFTSLDLEDFYEAR